MSTMWSVLAKKRNEKIQIKRLCTERKEMFVIAVSTLDKLYFLNGGNRKGNNIAIRGWRVKVHIGFFYSKTFLIKANSGE